MNSQHVPISSPKPIQGSYEFLFEFKARDGVLLFIRYREGEREFATTNRVFYGLADKEQWAFLIEKDLRTYAGTTKYVIKKAISTATA